MHACRHYPNAIRQAIYAGKKNRQFRVVINQEVGFIGQAICKNHGQVGPARVVKWFEKGDGVK